MMELRHARMSVQLYELSANTPSQGSTDSNPSKIPLLLLHALGSSASEWSDEWRSWNGPVYALDFAGHGESDRLVGGGYYAEYFLADADLALAAIGDRAYLAGAGMGAYVALLLAGSRPDRVPAALLLPGRGLACGGSEPDFDRRPDSVDTSREKLSAASREYSDTTDPWVARCGPDFRPIDYVSQFASAAHRLLFSEAVDYETARNGSLDWWREALRSSGGKLAAVDLRAALDQLASAPAEP